MRIKNVSLNKKALITTKLEDYQPGATRDEIMASLKKALVNPSHESTKAIKGNVKENGDNGKTNRRKSDY